MKNIVNTDYNNCIVNVSCSILKYFDIEHSNNSLKVIDDILNQKKPRNVILLLCDGMGYNILNKYLNKNDFLIKNLYGSIDSVFPSTTAAATTSVLTGLYPNEHGWLGWDNYVKPIDKVVTMFLNKIKDTDEDAAKYNVSRKYFGYESIINKINNKSDCYARYISPFDYDIKYKINNLNDMFSSIKNNLNRKEKNYIYAYYPNPDEIMHEYGTDSIKAINNIKLLNNRIEKFCSKLEDTLVLVIADHGHINSSYFILEDYSDIFELLSHTTSIDSRSTMFFIKEGKNHEFEELFNKYFKDYFILLNKKEIIDNKIFGIGKNHELFESCLGDYIAVSIKDKNLKYINKDLLVSSHAGITSDETLVPLIIIDKTK